AMTSQPSDARRAVAQSVPMSTRENSHPSSRMLTASLMAMTITRRVVDCEEESAGIQAKATPLYYAFERKALDCAHSGADELRAYSFKIPLWRTEASSRPGWRRRRLGRSSTTR